MIQQHSWTGWSSLGWNVNCSRLLKINRPQTQTTLPSMPEGGMRFGPVLLAVTEWHKRGKPEGVQEWGGGSRTKEKTWALQGGHDKARSIIVSVKDGGHTSNGIFSPWQEAPLTHSKALCAAAAFSFRALRICGNSEDYNTVIQSHMGGSTGGHIR